MVCLVLPSSDLSLSTSACSCDLAASPVSHFSQIPASGGDILLIQPGVVTILLVLTRPTILDLRSCLLILSWSLSLSWLEDDSGGDVVEDEVGDEVEVLGGSDENPLSLFKFKLNLFSFLDPNLTGKIKHI